MDIQIVNMTRKASDGGVVDVHWWATEKSGGHTQIAKGIATFEPNPNDPNFVPFEQLSKDQVMSWLHNTVDFETVEAEINEALQNRINPPVINGLPWDFEE